jgi:predicted Rossmann-fold nucleotide-binding protein
MKVIICGGRDFNNYDQVKKAVINSGFEITEVVSGGAKGADSLGERWAKENNVPVKLFPADWNNIKAKGAIIKVNQWHKKFNSRAGLDRNELMALYADALIAMDGGSGTADMIKRATKHELAVYIHELEDDEYEYKF